MIKERATFIFRNFSLWSHSGHSMARMVMKLKMELKRMNESLIQFWFRPSSFIGEKMAAPQSGVPFFLDHPVYNKVN